MTVVDFYSRRNGEWSGFGSGSAGHLVSNRQKRPYTSGPYRSVKKFIEKAPPGRDENAGPYVTGALEHDTTEPAWLEAQAVQTARARLNQTLIRSRAALGITAATANQSFQMIAKRASQLRNAYTALRRGNMKQFGRTLGIEPGRNRRKDAASLWLEYTFGWVPLVNDIYNAAEVLSDPFDVHRSFGTATRKGKTVHRGETYEAMVSKHVRVVCTAGLQVTNPNLALLNQLGLANPAAVAWDLIPFSFVVDWFAKVNRYVNTWNDMAGFSYVDPVTTLRVKVNGVFTRYDWFDLKGYTVTGNGRRRERLIGISNLPRPPQLSLPVPSLWLASTSTALLVQVFGKK